MLFPLPPPVWASIVGYAVAVLPVFPQRTQGKIEAVLRPFP